MFHLRRGTADAEIRVLLLRSEPEIGSLFQPCNRPECNFSCFAYFQEFCNSNLCPPESFNFVFCPPNLFRIR